MLIQSDKVKKSVKNHKNLKLIKERLKTVKRNL